MRHYPIGVHKYIPKQFIVDVAKSGKPYNMVGSGIKKKDVGSMKAISGSGEMKLESSKRRTIAPLRFKL